MNIRAPELGARMMARFLCSGLSCMKLPESESQAHLNLDPATTISVYPKLPNFKPGPTERAARNLRDVEPTSAAFSLELPMPPEGVLARTV
jgi:hypothetical protein